MALWYVGKMIAQITHYFSSLYASITWPSVLIFFVNVVVCFFILYLVAGIVYKLGLFLYDVFLLVASIVFLLLVPPLFIYDLLVGKLFPMIFSKTRSIFKKFSSKAELVEISHQEKSAAPFFKALHEEHSFLDQSN